MSRLAEIMASGSRYRVTLEPEAVARFDAFYEIAMRHAAEADLMETREAAAAVDFRPLAAVIPLHWYSGNVA